MDKDKKPKSEFDLPEDIPDLREPLGSWADKEIEIEIKDIQKPKDTDFEDEYENQPFGD